ncbi:outer membrane beta-barrel family protein [Rufibacter roseus]|uniref:TonB-dependent receptor domain-containing protein n=1 Tax=Rufibacter roseus TaxID=1567108 RepID=A0ABW2DLQ6_9BACT|nr:outer membrane beta-barrel family protein [Rufibacter roseus]
MKKLFLLSIFALLVCFSSTIAASGANTSVSFTKRSQHNSTTVTGVVQDTTSKQAVGFATVALQDKEGKNLTGTSADENGKFSLPQVAPGKYNLAISFIGYQTKIYPITVSSGATTLNVGTILLETDSKKLEEVVVTGEKDLVQETDDGLVYNAENDITNIGGTAADVLKKVPQLSVDLDGNVELRGSNKVRILINGKPSSILGDNLAEALEQIPSDMIKSVEVITSPSAKYDAEGSAGVVNIITKQSNLEGMTGSVTATTGNRANRLNTHLNVRKKGLGVRASVGGNFNDRFGDSESEQQYFMEEDQVLYASKQIRQTSTFDNTGRSLFSQLGADYDFNEKNNLSANMRVNRSGSLNERILNSIETNADGALIRQYNRNIDNVGQSRSVDLNVRHKKKFHKEDQELELMAIYNTNQRNSDYSLDQQNADGVIDYLERNDNHGTNREMVFQADYSHPFDKWGHLEVGSKAVLRSSASNYQFSSARSPEAPLEVNPARSNVFNYDQDVYSSYFSYRYRLDKKYVLRLGGRYEYTNVHGHFATTGSTIDRPFSNFMPNIMFLRNFENNQRIRISYSTRIHRPGIWQLNPYRNESNRINIRYGNPELESELTHNTDLSYSWFIKRTSVSASAYWRQTNNDIGHYQLPVVENGDTIQHTTYRNLGKNASYGTNLSLNTRFLEKGQFGANFNIFYNDLLIDNGTTTLRRSGFMYNMSSNASYRFQKEFSVQAAGSYNSGRMSLQSKSTPFYSYSMGLRKQFMNRKASLSLNVENFLFSNNTIQTTVRNPNSVNSNFNNNYNRIVRLSFNFRFGKMEFKSDKVLKKLVDEPEQKRG